MATATIQAETEQENGTWRKADNTQDFCQLYSKAYFYMLMARVLDDKFAALYRAGKIHGGVFLGRGQEALSAALGVHLRRGDVFAPLIRDQAGRFAFGETVLDAVRTYLGSPLGPMRARDGNVHRGRPKDGLLPMISHLGAMISVTSGCLLAKRMQGKTGYVGATCIGDGGTSTGSFHEALNMAAVERLPLVLVIANNQYAYSTPTLRQFACSDLMERAVGYGVTGYRVDGTDLEACLETLGQAVHAARSGQGPQLVVANLLRLAGHGEHDVADYVDEELKRSKLGRDCLKVAESFLLLQQWQTPQSLDQMRREAIRAINEAVETVQRESPPDPNAEDWCALRSTHLVEGFPKS